MEFEDCLTFREQQQVRDHVRDGGGIVLCGALWWGRDLVADWVRSAAPEAREIPARWLSHADASRRDTPLIVTVDVTGDGAPLDPAPSIVHHGLADTLDEARRRVSMRAPLAIRCLRPRPGGTSPLSAALVPTAKLWPEPV